MSRDPNDVLKGAASKPRKGPDVAAAMRRGTTLKKRRYAYIAGATILVVGALSLGATALSRNIAPPVPPSSKTHRSGFVIYQSHHPTFSLRYPTSWYRARQSLTPSLTSPKELFSIGTRPLRYRATNCAHLPKSALQDLSSRDAFISVEEGGNHGFPARPADFQTGAHPVALECVPRGAPLNVYWLRFRDSGRGFYALVAIGKRASGKLTAQTWAGVNSFSTTSIPRRICPIPANGYRPVLSPTSGVPGSLATVSGQLPQTGEGGQLVLTTSIDVWWNLDPQQWESALADHPSPSVPGPAFSVAKEAVRNLCTFRLQFDIPQVASGSYPVVVLYFGGGGAASFEPVKFHVR